MVLSIHTQLLRLLTSKEVSKMMCIFKYSKQSKKSISFQFTPSILKSIMNHN